jgi:hypothetical protein
MISLLVDFFWRDPLNFIASALGCLAPFFLVVIWRLRRSCARAVAANARLRRDLENRELILEKGRSLNKDLLARLPASVWKAIARKQHDNDPTGADYALTKWLAEDGPTIAHFLYARAKRAYVRAATGDRSACLVCAEGYATAALACNPDDAEAAAFAKEIAAIRKTEGRVLPALPEALPEALQTLSSPGQTAASDSFGADLAWTADAIESEAVRQYEVGRCHSALAAIEAALELRNRIDGAETIAILNALSLKGYILIGLERAAEALPIVLKVAEAMIASPDYGPDHPDTLSCRYQAAVVLEVLGQTDEALAAINDVVERQTRHPRLGPNHPDTMESRRLMNRLLKQD